MKRIINHRDFNVFKIEKEVWDIDYHNHNFYEIIIIEAGRGQHRLNDVVFSYKKGDVFLLKPSDMHEFIIGQKTKFIYIKFTALFLQDILINLKNNTRQSVDLLLNRPAVYESTVRKKEDTLHMLQLARMLLHYFSSSISYKEEMIHQLIAAMMIVMAGNILEYPDNKKWVVVGGEKIDHILAYISVYATDKQKMRIENIAASFMLSPNYVSIYVKQFSGLSIRQHILNYKIRTAEKLLKQSSYSINEIVDQLGFNDASHFNKIFKKYSGLAPSAFRKGADEKFQKGIVK